MPRRLTQLRSPPSRRHPPAFTLLELMTVIGLIALLTGLLTIALSHVLRAAKTSQTRATLQTCQAIYAGYDAIRRPRFDHSNIPAPQGVGAALLTDADTQYTALFMSAFAAVPTARDALAKLPPATIAYVSPPVANRGAWTATPTPPYYLGDNVTDAADGVAAATLIQPYPANPAPLTSDTSHWFVYDPARAGPVLRDAWGNPIVLIVSGNMGPTNARPTAGVTVGGVANTAVSSPDSRPFFASAGPDGDFQAGDDNLYSFER